MIEQYGHRIDIPNTAEQIEFYENDEATILFCSICAQIIASHARFARIDVLQDEAFIHTLSCPPENNQGEYY